jgi:hypothetical protein
MEPRYFHHVTTKISDGCDPSRDPEDQAAHQWMNWRAGGGGYLP